MTRLMVVVTAALALIAAACGGDSSDEEADGATETTAASETTASDDDAGAAEGGSFAIVEVGVGDASQYAVIQNTGDSAGNLEGFAICQAPGYHTFGDIELAPGELLVVSLGGDMPEISSAAKETVTADIGSIGPADGEIGLYTTGDFGNSGAIVDYVEWGSSDHTRSSVATEAGIWPAGDFVETTDATVTLVSSALPTGGAADWDVG